MRRTRAPGAPDQKWSSPCTSCHRRRTNESGSHVSMQRACEQRTPQIRNGSGPIPQHHYWIELVFDSTGRPYPKARGQVQEFRHPDRSRARSAVSRDPAARLQRFRQAQPASAPFSAFPAPGRTPRRQSAPDPASRRPRFRPAQPASAHLSALPAPGRTPGHREQPLSGTRTAQGSRRSSLPEEITGVTEESRAGQERRRQAAAEGPDREPRRDRRTRHPCLQGRGDRQRRGVRRARPRRSLRPHRRRGALARRSHPGRLLPRHREDRRRRGEVRRGLGPPRLRVPGRERRLRPGRHRRGPDLDRPAAGRHRGAGRQGQGQAHRGTGEGPAGSRHQGRRQGRRRGRQVRRGERPPRRDQGRLRWRRSRPQGRAHDRGDPGRLRVRRA